MLAYQSDQRSRTILSRFCHLKLCTSSNQENNRMLLLHLGHGGPCRLQQMSGFVIRDPNGNAVDTNLKEAPGGDPRPHHTHRLTLILNLRCIWASNERASRDCMSHRHIGMALEVVGIRHLVAQWLNSQLNLLKMLWRWKGWIECKWLKLNWI